MYSRSMLFSPHLPALVNAMRLSALPDVVLPRIERMTAPLSSWKRVEDTHQLSLSVPGLSPSDIDIELHEEVIDITLTRGEEERAVLRTRVPQQVDPSTLSAKLSRGVLTLSLNTLPERQPRKIEVLEVQAEPDQVNVKSESQGQEESQS